VAEEKQGFIDRLGPTLTSGLIIAVLSATSLGAVSIRDLVITTNVDIAYLKSELSTVRTELEKFKSPGGRFTATDGAKHETRIEKLEQFQTTCIETKSKIDSRLDRIEDKQDDVCLRVHDCIREVHKQELHNGNTSTNNSSSNRSRN
jgi:hypothetical protein